jgi:hypothetical protein
MADDPYADRKRLTFEQAEGVDALPTQMLPKEVTRELRAVLWAAVFASISKGVRHDNLGYSYARLGSEWSQILYDYHVFREHLPADDYNNDAKFLIPKIKELMLAGQYFRIFGFLQFVLRHQNRPHLFREEVETALSTARSAYKIVGGDPRGLESRVFVNLRLYQRRTGN